MHTITSKVFMIIITSTLSLALYAQNNASQNKQPQVTPAQDEQTFAKFKDACIKAWMEKADQASDKIAFQKFGEQYCQCALGKPIDTDEAIKKAAQTCMSQTLLHETMDTLQGSSNLTSNQIEAACQGKWDLIYPGMDEKVKQVAAIYCQCAGVKLIDMNKQKDNLSADQYGKEINDIAATCASKVEADKSTIKINNNNKS